jgi:hypothetical protein
MPKDPDQHAVKETKQRLQSLLHGAFSGPPTPLKDIPKRNGETRAIGKDEPRKRRRQRKKRAA